MFGPQLHDPTLFIAVIREYHGASPEARGPLANALSDAIISKRVDLAQVRHLLLEGREEELLHTLEQLIELIEPYISEGGVDE